MCATPDSTLVEDVLPSSGSPGLSHPYGFPHSRVHALSPRLGTAACRLDVNLTAAEAETIPGACWRHGAVFDGVARSAVARHDGSYSRPYQAVWSLLTLEEAAMSRPLTFDDPLRPLSPADLQSSTVPAGTALVCGEPARPGSGRAGGQRPGAARLGILGRRRPGPGSLARLGTPAARHHHPRPDAAVVRPGRDDHQGRDDRAHPGARRVQPGGPRAALRDRGGHGRRRQRRRDLAGRGGVVARPPAPARPDRAPLPGVRRAATRPDLTEGHGGRRAVRDAAERVPAAALPDDAPAGGAAPFDDHQGRLGLEVR